MELKLIQVVFFLLEDRSLNRTFYGIETTSDQTEPYK